MFKTITKVGAATIISILFAGIAATAQGAAAQAATAQDTTSPTSTEPPAVTSYLRALISAEEAFEAEKSTVFDASQSFVPAPGQEVLYNWEFGDGNKNEGVQVLHAYQHPGRYEVKLTIDDGISASSTTKKVFVYSKLIVLITDQSEAQERIEIIRELAEEKGVYIKVLDSFGASTEFISEEILTKKMTETSAQLRKAAEIIIWTKENAGLNAISRFIQTNQDQNPINFKQKSIAVLESNLSSQYGRIQRQFQLINPQRIVLAEEAAIYRMIESTTEEDFTESLERGGYEYEIIDAQSGHVRPWNFMSYFVNVLIDNGIPDNTIALLLLLPVIATIVAFMRQVVGVTTFGIYTPSIITLSFLIIGIYAGLLTLCTAILIGALSRPILKKVRMLFIPKMAIVITIVSLALFLILIITNYLGLFNAEFLSIAIFPMLILSTLVEKFISVKSDKGLFSAAALMFSTVLVAIIAYFIVGGEIPLFVTTLKISFVKNLIINYPETVILLIVVNLILGKWTGLRILERVRFREVFRHIEE